MNLLRVERIFIIDKTVSFNPIFFFSILVMRRSSIARFSKLGLQELQQQVDNSVEIRCSRNTI